MAHDSWFRIVDAFTITVIDKIKCMDPIQDVFLLEVKIHDYSSRYLTTMAHHSQMTASFIMDTCSEFKRKRAFRTTYSKWQKLKHEMFSKHFVIF